MAELSPGDKLSLTKFLEGATVSLASLQAMAPVIKDDGLKKLCESSIGLTEAQIKGIQEFCQSHGLA